MNIRFVGVGDATDVRPNTSVLIENKSTWLLDCGYSVPSKVWEYSQDPNLVDTIFISHFHADHYFGLPALMLHMVAEGREKDLTIVCLKGQESYIDQVLSLSYGSIFESRKYQTKIMSVTPENTAVIGEYTCTFAQTEHPRENIAIKLNDGTHVIGYSGDGRMTPASKQLFSDCDLLIHDAFHEFDKPSGEAQGHESIQNLLEYKRTHSIKTLAMVHVWRKYQNIAAKYENDSCIFPKTGDVIKL